MARARRLGHDDHLTVVEHLDELRTRLMRALIALAAAFGLTFWQNHLVLEVFNRPLRRVDEDLLGTGGEPLSLGVTEQFTTTITLAGYAAILLALPVILYQLYAFVLPAFSARERRVAAPLLAMIPVMFVGGVAFGYFVVIEPATEFLLSFNSDEFTTAVRARDYYSFVSLALVSLGLLYQMPIGILAATRLGLTSPEALRRNRRYAILACAVLAALLPTIDPVTMILEMIPLVILYELSILLARAFGTPRAGATAVEPAARGAA
ncbi:MAG: twin-arginine translocase subunit TatC [Actinomycetota bacterium]|nr:twin-arginine translocase subunit TatC [Actinomycetota bacterium]